MTLRNTAIVLTAGALLGAGAAFAQPAPQATPYRQGTPQGSYQQAPAQGGYKHHGHGLKSIVSEEVRAGRLSEKEGTLIMQKVRQMHAEKRAERQARMNGEGAPPQQTQQPR
ncbi:MAG TPA: hypothetical protein VGL35_01940 [Rhizomicrobium sp.]|jgi:hypothetical protein